MTNDIFDNPEMSDSMTRQAELPEAPIPDFSDDAPEIVTQADLIDTSDIPVDPVLAAGPARMTGEEIRSHTGGPSIDPSKLSDHYAREVLEQQRSEQLVMEREEELVEVEVDLDEMTTDEKLAYALNKVRELEARPAAQVGGAYPGCKRCAGTGRGQFHPNRVDGGYVYKGQPVMIRCQLCFPGGDVEAEVNDAIRAIARG